MQKGFEVVNLHGTASGVIAVPVIGENGNWWIGNEDTGIKAQGEPGQQVHRDRQDQLEQMVLLDLRDRQGAWLIWMLFLTEKPDRRDLYIH